MAKKPYPYKWVPLDQEEARKRLEIFPNEFSPEHSVVKSSHGNFCMPKKFADCGYAEDIYNMEVRPDDVWIVTYPKCGTTWTQEIVWQVMHGVDLSIDRPPFYERSPFLEMSSLFPGPLLGEEDPVPPEGFGMPPMDKTDPRFFGNSLVWTNKMKGPRLIKTHLSMELLPPNLLDVAKDVCVSYFHHTAGAFGGLYGFKGTFEQYADLFLKGGLGFGDYFHHLKSGWPLRNHPNFTFLWFEDMKSDLIPVIKDLCRFTGRHLTDYQTLVLDDAMYIDNFRKMHVEEKTSTEGKEIFKNFIRKGKVGDHKSKMSEDVEAKFDKWIDDNCSGTDLPNLK